VSPERTPPSLFPATQRQLHDVVIPLFQRYWFAMLVAADDDLLCVHAKCKELVRDSIRKYY
jgi:hypothetical protein